MARTCLASGYKYKLEIGPPPRRRKGNWRTSNDEKWDTVVTKVVCGRKVGERTIDGTRVVVVGARGTFYAATPPHAKSYGRR